MKVRVLFFAALAHDIGKRDATLDLSDNATVKDALSTLAREYPAVGRYQSRLATAVNLEYVGPEHPLCDNDELAVIPPVSGG